jgi:pimeloyl-ACP methyl ester carboxylesterase
MNCPDLASLTGGFDLALVEQATTRCLESLTGDPRFYTTSVAVRDLDAVREALGYDSLNIYGVSYGTRVAMHYTRRYPNRVRTLVIDGVVPPELALGPAAALNAQTTFERQLQRCQSDSHCAAAFPDLKRQYAELEQRLRQTPVTVELPDPVTGRQRTLEVGTEHLAGTLRLLSYTPETSALIPLIINEAYANANYLPIASNALRIMEQLSSQISVGMHNAVVCTEDVPFLGTVDWPALDATYLGRDQVDALIATCNIWPAGILDDDLRLPLTLDTPTLILSGEEDPITPFVYGELVAGQLPNALHVIAPGQAHGVFNRGCIPGLITRFIEQADWRNLDPTCVRRLAAQPFFIDSMGPSP